MIGVFDSGIGGLSVLQALLAELPDEDFVYLADSGHAPYGERDDAHVMARARTLTDHLVQRGARALVVACNTATAVAIAQLRSDYPDLPIIGVEPALKPAVALSRTGRIGVMATRSTLNSAKFQQLLASLDAQAEFVLQACDGLAAAIEKSVSDVISGMAQVHALCELHTRAMGRFGTDAGQIDTLVLGCTHYPFAQGRLRSLLGDKINILDTGVPVAKHTKARLASLPPTAASVSPRQVQLLSTGHPGDLERAAQLWIHPLLRAHALA